jgi:hypothetical protein
MLYQYCMGQVRNVRRRPRLVRQALAIATAGGDAFFRGLNWAANEEFVHVYTFSMAIQSPPSSGLNVTVSRSEFCKILRSCLQFS